MSKDSHPRMSQDERKRHRCTKKKGGVQNKSPTLKVTPKEQKEMPRHDRAISQHEFKKTRVKRLDNETTK